MSYSIWEHKHRFAAWAASRAASVKGCRFSVKQGVELIVAAGLDKMEDKPTNLPTPHDIDLKHLKWREKIITYNEGLNITHGVAAKLINMYLKSIFVCGGSESHPNVMCLHPPIDRLLLNSLIKKEMSNGKEKDQTLILKLREYRDKGWSKWKSPMYIDAINTIRTITGNNGMWTIEKHWKGYQ